MTRTRFAPSPTGFLHIGSLRTALYAYALAKHDQGSFILRIEDTDQKREVVGATPALQDTLSKFGLQWDEFFTQSDRHTHGIYRRSAEHLVSAGLAFFCDCPPKNAKTQGYSTELRDPCRNKKLTHGAVKLKVPDNQQLSYYDFVHRKDISWDSNTVYDATLLKSDGFPTYHLAAMTDDLDMHISHILRGHDWLPSTPIHLLVLDGLGGPRPQIGHLTDILSATSGKKLSKRRDSVFVENFLDSGYLPEALLNFVMLLGWAPKDNRELYSLPEFVEHFDIAGFQEANPRFLSAKLDWFNGHYIRQLTDTKLTQLVKPHVKNHISESLLTQILPLVKDRIVRLTDAATLIDPFVTTPQYSSDLWSDTAALDHLSLALEHFSNITSWSKSELEAGLIEKVKARNWKVGDFFMSLRIAIFASRFTPPITDALVILGRKESLNRISSAIKFLNM